VEEFLRTLWAQKTKMKTTIAFALLNAKPSGGLGVLRRRTLPLVPVP
jgi:hypothetical protein